MQERENQKNMTHLQVGSGKGRDFEKIQKHIHCLPYENGKPITVSKIARDMQISPQLVHNTIRGLKNNKRVLEKLISLDVPLEWLYPSYQAKK